MEFVHESVVERGEVFQALRACFFQALEEEDLGAWVDLLQKVAELSHCIAACWDAQHIVNKTLDELLGHIFAAQVPIGEFSRGQKLIKGYGLRSKWK